MSEQKIEYIKEKVAISTAAAAFAVAVAGGFLLVLNYIIQGTF
jgi:hypothetical protein